ncbi:ras association domain-containing protein 1-like protein [Dermatophagoides farinae]|uniref:Ras association domain-containing protein 1-like protein n=1 Tax=Dermatophagoides farinae TaxID=6954 RepID=A0A9D4P9X6_DERFA|nr:ras association domain-containing protein 1-like protein [Dermatophagoides farinae]
MIPSSNNDMAKSGEIDSNNNNNNNIDDEQKDDQNIADIISITNSIDSFDVENNQSTFSTETSFADDSDDESSETTTTMTTSNNTAVVNKSSIIESYLITPRIILDLRAKILKYNERVRSRGSGLGITLIDEERCLFRGFLRVHMNLTRPINVIAGKRPPSIYDIINEEENNQNQRRTLTSFYMPRDTVKNIHITSDSTSLQVIKAMLKKFKVVDNPQKFALYLRRRFPQEELNKNGGDEVINNDLTRISDDNQNEMTISKFLKTAGHEHSLKRLHDHERPLILQLEFDSFAYGSVDIVLQENDNADIAWDAFEVPELRNFLKILEREEGEHLEHVKNHYHEMHRILKALIDYEETE